MQVSNHPTYNQIPITDNSVEIKQGEVYQATIKEKLNTNEAIIQIKGKEQLAKFEDGVPSENRVTVQVNGQKDQAIHVKTIATENSKVETQVSSEEKILKSLGLTGKESTGLKQAVQILLDKGSPLSKEIVSDLKEFIDKEKGPLETKIETVKALANKRLEATHTQLRAVHEALHGKPLNQVLSDIAKEIDPEFKLEKIEAPGGKQPDQTVAKPTQTEANKMLQTQTSKEPTSIVNESNKQTQQASSRSNEASELVRKTREIVEKEPDLKKAIQQIREAVINNPKIDRELARKIEKAAVEAEKLQSIGKERLLQALKTAETEVMKKEQLSVQQNVQANQLRGAVSVLSEDGQLSNLVKELKTEVTKDPNIFRSIEKIKNQIIENPRFPKEVIDKVKRAVDESATLARQGRITTGKDVLSNALTEVQAEVEKSEGRGSQPVQSAQPERSTSELRQPSQSTQPVQATEAARTQSEPRPSEMVREIRAELQREPNLQRAVETVREQVVSNPKIEREIAQKVEQALREVAQLKQIGQESAGRERLQQALAKAEVELRQIESRQQSLQNEPPKQPAQPTQTNQSTQPERSTSEPRQPVQPSQLDRNITELRQSTEAAQPSSKSDSANRQPEAQLPKQESQQLSEAIKQVREQIQTETDPKKVLQKVQEQIINNKNLDPEVTRNIERLANQANQLDQAGRERIIKMLQQVEEALKQSEPKTNSMESSSNTNQKEQQLVNTQQQTTASNTEEILEQQSKLPEIRPSDTIKQALQQLLKEANLEQALNQVRREITSNPNIDMKTIDKAEKALNHASQLLDKGREIAARQHLTKELTEIQQELAKTEPKQNQQPLIQEQYDINEQLQSMQIQSKDILVTKVTQKLAQATHDFRELKREITRNLDNVIRLIETFKSNAYPQARQMLETAISKLDNAILKSEMMLFTDMKTEKQLMQASGQLADAKKLLARGDFNQAGKIANEVKTLIDKLIFKPTEQKIMHFVNKESMALENRTPERNMLAQYGQTSSSYMNQEPSARQMFEMVRSLGLNHDSDIANSLVFQKNDQSQQEQQQQQNLKAALLKLAQGEETNTKIAQQAEQALTNLTGQQLLSKSDASGTLQSMFFNLPLLLGGKPENLQVFVNSKNEGQQVDWENCNLYFLLETRKLGDVGILLNSTDRNLSITIKNDLPGFKERMEPLTSMTKEKLQEVGYNVNNISFARMTPVTTNHAAKENAASQTNEAKVSRPIFTEKGMDFKI